MRSLAPDSPYRVWQGDADGDVGGFECELLELVPDQRIVFRWSFVGPERAAGPAYDSLLTITLGEAPGGATTLTLVHERLEALLAAMPYVAENVGRRGGLQNTPGFLNLTLILVKAVRALRRRPTGRPKRQLLASAEALEGLDALTDNRPRHTHPHLVHMFGVIHRPGMARHDAVSRVGSPKATVYSSTASADARIPPFDGVARAARRVHTHVMRANEALTFARES